MKKLSAFVLLAVLSMHLLGGTVRAEIIDAPDAPGLMIHELQTSGVTEGGMIDGRIEFVEIYNPGEQKDITGWRLEYLSASHSGQGAPTRVLAEFRGTVNAHGYVLIGSKGHAADMLLPETTSSSGLLAQGGGHVRMVDSQSKVIDLVTWGSGVAIGQWPKVATISPGRSLERMLSADGVTRGQGYALRDRPTPQGGDLEALREEPIVSCELVISEILPNPAGADGAKEYIEVYNSTPTAQSLDTCWVKIGAEEKLLALPDEMLESGAYRALYAADIEFTLPNSTGAEVWLIGGDNEMSVRYTDGLADDEAWAYVNEGWQKTPIPTPGAANRLPDPKHERIDEEPGVATSCAPGKERNPETGRCRSIARPQEPMPCKTGQQRSPETGRCRVANIASSRPIACRPGQERNSETGRCRHVLAVAAVPKVCPQAHVRNPETGRCRKQTSGAVTLAKVQDLPADDSNSSQWLIAGVLSAGLIGYAAYEWRHDVLNACYKLRPRSKPK
ncbi:MAG TPA: lamin tail domain-containing protein [Candidatus Saccharimonadales bacterium]